MHVEDDESELGLTLDLQVTRIGLCTRVVATAIRIVVVAVVSVEIVS